METSKDLKSCPDVPLRTNQDHRRIRKARARGWALKTRMRLPLQSKSVQKELVAGCLNKPHISSLAHDAASLTLNNGQDVHDDASTTQPPKKSKDFVNKKRKKKLKYSLKGVSHPSPKRRIGANVRFWLWRNWKKVRCRLSLSNARGRREVQSCLNRHNTRSGSTTKTQSRKRKVEVESHWPQDQRELSERTLALAEDRPVKESSLQDPMTSIREVRAESLTSTDISRSAAGQSGLNKMGQSDGKHSSVQFCEHTSPPALSSCINSQTLQVCSVDRDIIRRVKKAQKELLLSSERHREASRCKPVPCKRVGPLEQRTVTPLQEPIAGTHTGGTNVACKKTHRKMGPFPTQRHTDISNEVLKRDIHEFLDGFYRMYGSFFALQRKDTLSHLRSKFRMDLNNERRSWVLLVAATYQAAVVRRPVPSFQVVYKKHMLTLEDLSSLENDNWLNDQVINMYGELIMESSHHKVHFFNSFFHEQLINKGYEGVRRWTKQVDLFSKQLLLVPVHLDDVHWCLVAVDTVEKRLHLYDSQGVVFEVVAPLQDVMNYLRIEAKERRQTTFQNDWIVSVKEGVPQQTNENDCGVFVLEYCRCLASGKPFDFTQKHIPWVRQRIYKELCDCKIQERSRPAMTL